MNTLGHLSGRVDGSGSDMCPQTPRSSTLDTLTSRPLLDKQKERSTKILRRSRRFVGHLIRGAGEENLP